MQLDKKTIAQLGLAAACCLLLAWLLNNFAAVGRVFSVIWGVIFPFFVGFVIAFLLNIPMTALERHALKRMPLRWRRPLGFGLTVLLVLGFLALIVFLVVPQLVQTVEMLSQAMPGYLKSWEAFFQPYLDYLPTVQQWFSGLDLDWEGLINQIMSVLGTGAGSFFTSAVGVASSILGGLFSFFVGLVFACYLLFDKEHMSAQLQGLLKAYLPLPKYEKLRALGQLTAHTYTRFISGQCIEALIVGVAYTIILFVGRFDYALLIGVLVGITTLIPLIGAYLGCFIGAFFILVSMGFWRTVAFVILFVIIQQFEGNLLYPHVVGNSVGLPPVWILVAVIAGGSLAGLLGALFFIPLFSVLFTLLRQNALRRLAKKGVPSPVEALPKPPAKKHNWFKRHKQ